MKSRVSMVEATNRIKNRLHFCTQMYTMTGYNTVLGDYEVTSYGDHLATVKPDGAVLWSKGRYKPHYSIVEQALGVTR